MAYIGGVGSFAGPIVGAVIITFLQITLSDVIERLAALFRPDVHWRRDRSRPGGVVGWAMLHRQAALQAEQRGGSRPPTPLVGAGARREPASARSC